MKFEELKRQVEAKLKTQQQGINSADLKANVERVILVCSGVCAGIAMQPIPFAEIHSQIDFLALRFGLLNQYKFKSALDAMDLGDINGDGKESLEFLVKVFELRKRLYSEYQSGYKPNENSDYRRYDYYILLGYLLCQAYRITDNLKYLNTMLKLNDILLSLSNVLDEQQKRCTATLLNREMDFVETLAGQCGIAM